MNAELYINDFLIDLEPGTSNIGVTFQVNDIAELKDRKANTTNQFKIPKTANNRKALGFTDIVNSQSVIPYRKNNVKYIEGGVELVSNGYAIVDESSTHFLVQVLSGNADFFSVIKNKKLSDLDLSEFNHEWNFVSVNASFPNLNGYTYPMIDYWDMFDDVTIFNDPRRMFPSMFCKTLLQRIVSQAGFMLAGSFTEFPSEKYQRLILPYSNLYPKHTPKYQEQFFLKVTKTTTQQVQGLIPDDIVTFETVNFDNGGHWNAGLNSFVPIKAGAYNIKVTAIVDVALLSGSPTMSLVISNSTVTTSSVYSKVLAPGTNQTVTFVTGDIYLSTTQPLNLQLLVSGVAGDIIIYPDSTLEVIRPVSDEAFYNSEWEMAINQPDLGQDEFIKMIANVCCLIVTTDPVSKTVYLENFSEIKKNIPIARDWSNKIDIQNPETINFRINNYAQTNNFKYKEDSGVPKGLGDGSFTIDDETMELVKDIIVLPVAATEMKKKWVVYWIPVIRIYDTVKLERIEVKPRLLLHFLSFGPINTPGTPKIQIYDGTDLLEYSYTNNVPFAWFIHDENFTRPEIPIPENLGFDNNLKTKHFSELIAMLYRLKKVTAYFKLNAVDVQNFDHMIPVYIDHFNEYFFVNKISNYKPNQLTQVELYRL